MDQAAAKEHVSDIEMCICTVNYHSRSVASALPFQYPHKLISTDIIYFAVFCLNTPPIKNGVSTKYSLCAIMSYTNLILMKY